MYSGKVKIKHLSIQNNEKWQISSARKLNGFGIDLKILFLKVLKIL